MKHVEEIMLDQSFDNQLIKVVLCVNKKKECQHRMSTVNGCSKKCKTIKQLCILSLLRHFGRSHGIPISINATKTKCNNLNTKNLTDCS